MNSPTEDRVLHLEGRLSNEIALGSEYLKRVKLTFQREGYFNAKSSAGVDFDCHRLIIDGGGHLA